MQSAIMAGMKVVPVKTLPDGNLDLADLRAKAEKHKDNLAAFMVHSSHTLLPESRKLTRMGRSLIPRHSACSKMASKRFVRLSHLSAHTRS